MLSLELQDHLSHPKWHNQFVVKLLKEELNISTVEDLLLFAPVKYIDKTNINQVRELPQLSKAANLHLLISSVAIVGKAKGRRLVANASDSTGSIQLVWFKGIEMMRKLVLPGHAYQVYGIAKKYGSKYNIAHPEIKLAAEVGSADELQPIYPLSAKVRKLNFTDEKIKGIIMQYLGATKIKDPLPEYVKRKLDLLDKQSAISSLHHPATLAEAETAIFRLKMEELLFAQLSLALKYHKQKKEIVGKQISDTGHHFKEFYHNHLPFELTGSQKEVLKQIWNDLKSGKQMNRLLQGDVGSGKSIVAALTATIVIGAGFSACYVAPTEILANQQFLSFYKLLAPLNLNIKLLTGSTSNKERKSIQTDLQHNTLHLLIGTHAILEKWISFADLGLVIIDEQHRFGVDQRAKLYYKDARPPHMLLMTATPIPRTLALTTYGDTDVSKIDELPPGRQVIDTHHLREAKRLQLFSFIKKQIKAGRQVYIVYPLIEESEKLDLANLTEGFQAIERAFPPPEFHLSMLHGQMSSEAKEFEMQRFKKGETHIMVATTVVEVGVDVPNATVIVIENAERFGLSQLHQLRGRVGRGSEKSYCFLMTKDGISNNAYERISMMVKTNDGFQLAEADLMLRGPGELTGTAQSGHANMRLVNLKEDFELLATARNVALRIADRDHKLELPEHAALKEALLNKSKKKNYLRIS